MTWATLFSAVSLIALAACTGSSGGLHVPPDLAATDVAASPDTSLPDSSSDGDPPPCCRFAPPGPRPDGAPVALHGFDKTPSLPFPSDIFTLPEDTSPSGVRLDLTDENTLLLDPALSLLTTTEQMLGLMAPMDGFSTWTPILFALSGPAATYEPISAEQSVAPDSPVFLVKLDSQAGTCNERHPVTVAFQQTEGPDGPITLLIIEPYLPLEPASRYAAVVTRGLVSKEDVPVQPHDHFRALMGCGGTIPASAPADRVQRAREVLAPFACSAPAAGSSTGPEDPQMRAPCKTCLSSMDPPLCACDLAAATVFTTGSPAAPLETVRAYLRSPDSPPLNLTLDPDGDGQPDVMAPADLPGIPTDVTAFPSTSLALKGAFDMPDLRGQDKDVLDALSGKPKGAETLRIGFVLMLPKGFQQPFRVVVLGHGHSGYKEQIAYLAEEFGKQGLALAAIDAIGHGDLADEGKFMTANIPEVRGSFFQTQADQLRLFQALEELADLDVYPLGAPDGIPDLDVGSGLGFIGESLGGLAGTPACAVEPGVTAAVLNVAGGGISTFAMGQITSMLPPGNELLLWSLKVCAQTLLQHMDPISFAYLLRGSAPSRGLFMQAVVGDELLDGPPTCDMARALDLTYVCPCPKEVPGLPTAAAPFSGNGLFYFGSPAVHGCLLAARQNVEISKGMRRQAAWFLRNALETGTGKILDPLEELPDYL